MRARRRARKDSRARDAWAMRRTRTAWDEVLAVRVDDLVGPYVERLPDERNGLVLDKDIPEVVVGGRDDATALDEYGHLPVTTFPKYAVTPPVLRQPLRAHCRVRLTFALPARTVDRPPKQSLRLGVGVTPEVLKGSPPPASKAVANAVGPPLTADCDDGAPGIVDA
jgi:hypothetical protein